MKRLSLAHLPTPLEHAPRLSERLGIELWIKRDDATGGPEAGNKIRKLEYLLADALAAGADTLVTCGGIQSNHARATAILAARLGLRSRLLLRWPELPDDGGMGITPDQAGVALTGNLFLDRMVGADVRLITVNSYRRRAQLMGEHAAELAAAGTRPYVIPEGGSNGLGALGYVDACREIRQQLDDAEHKPFDLIVHACGSGGTAAGLILGAARHRMASAVRVMAVCDDAATFEQRIEDIMAECRQLAPELSGQASYVVDDSAKGTAYAVSSEEQRACMIEAAQLGGLLLDPVYTGKAFHGLWQQARTFAAQKVLFVHTGGLPGLLVQAQQFQL